MSKGWAKKGSGRWEWPDGKNSKEYNAWYYKHNKDKWKKETDRALLETNQILATLTDAYGLTPDELSELSEEELQALIDKVQKGAAESDLITKVKLWSQKAGKVDPKTGLHLKKREYTEDEDMAEINPDYKDFTLGTKMNCTMCTTAYDLRRRGYDVMAAELPGANDDTVGYLKSMYKDVKDTDFVGTQTYYIGDGPDKKEFVQNNSEAWISYMESSYPDGSRGFMTVYLTPNFGHAVAWEMDDGDLVIRDCQSNKAYEGDEIYEGLLQHSNGLFWAVRLDDKELDPDGVKRGVR